MSGPEQIVAVVITGYIAIASSSYKNNAILAELIGVIICYTTYNSFGCDRFRPRLSEISPPDQGERKPPHGKVHYEGEPQAVVVHVGERNAVAGEECGHGQCHAHEHRTGVRQPDAHAVPYESGESGQRYENHPQVVFAGHTDYLGVIAQQPEKISAEKQISGGEYQRCYQGYRQYRPHGCAKTFLVALPAVFAAEGFGGESDAVAEEGEKSEHLRWIFSYDVTCLISKEYKRFRRKREPRKNQLK